MEDKVRVLVWSEFTEPKIIYPDGIHGAICSYLKQFQNLETYTVQLSDYGQGLTEDNLAKTDVLIWWGHAKHKEVTDENALRIVRHVRERGMGLLVLHSAHHSKPFCKLLECSGNLGGWREVGEEEKVWVISPDHPIAKGLPNPIVMEHEEMYSEPFDVPQPDELIMISWFTGGEVFRSGCCWQRDNGRIFYFRPGHETYPTFFHPDILRVIHNGVLWCANRI